ncbi:hypothetical protein [Actinospica robiniae]|uniref:hypothetical protein n=1 Tax=Actinospica robiniae TaxID=304901 RepID=UPI00040F47EC|nr:hypothetical protein [Actinospica robiniae]
MTPKQPRAHRRRIRVFALSIVAGAICLVTLAACTGGSGNQVSGGNTQSENTYKEFNLAVPYPYTAAAPSDPLERQNLAARLKMYNSAGDTNYVYIFAWGSPTPIGYYVIKGKVSSTGSQMTATQITSDCGNQGGCVLDAIGDDGSYGPEEGGENGVFFFTASGTLVETDQPFVVSSQPIKLYVHVPQLDASAS